MPIFEFLCRECGHESEHLIRSAETPDCPHCQSRALEKLMSAPAGHVAGKGALPIANSCPPSDAPLCSPFCCRAPAP